MFLTIPNVSMTYPVLVYSILGLYVCIAVHIRSVGKRSSLGGPRALTELICMAKI